MWIALSEKEMNHTDKNGKWDSGQMFPLIRKFEQSTKTRAEFCREMDIKPHVFQYWLGKYRKENKGLEAPSSFVSLQVPHSTQDTAESPILRITYPSGLVLEIPIV